MEESDILLSIAIPTRSRAHYLAPCLDHIVAQFDDPAVKNSVEIVISDNDSQDNTKEVGEEYARKFPNIRYFRNEKNIGFDGNTVASVLKSRGKYVWHIGDDDFMQNGALGFIVNFLRKKEVAVLTVGFHLFVDHNRSLKRVNDITENLMDYSTSAEEFYRKGYAEGTLGIYIFQKNLWQKIQEKINHYEGLGIYYEIMLQLMPTVKLPLAHLTYPVLFLGQDYKWNKRGTALFVYLYSIRLLKKLRTFGYSETFVQEELNLFSKSLISMLLKAKATDLQCNFTNLWAIYKELYAYPLQISLATLIYFIPNSLVKMAKRWRKQLRK